MGNCCSFGSAGYQPYASSQHSPGKRDGQIAATWKQTGIVGLRDRGLKEVPENVQNVGADAKVIPTSVSWVLWLMGLCMRPSGH